MTETVFDAAYLATVLACAVVMLFEGEIFGDRWIFGLAALLLCLGDAFHLVPRVISAWEEKRDYTKFLGRGKLIASITMTLFYLLLWQIGVGQFGAKALLPFTAALYILAALRIALSLFPQNKWQENASPLKWSLLRNIPFFLMGAFTAALFMSAHFKAGAYPYLWLAVIISFACYIPVVFFSQKHPKVGMLMLPKSLAYVAVIIIGLIFTAS